MPYVKQDVRDELQYPLDVINGHITDMLCSKPEDRAGILNYVITVLIDNAYGPLSGAKYRDYNEAIGMLECCKLEFYRKAAAPYEDLKEKENGKVLDGETRKKGFSNDPDKDRGIRFNITEEECINGKTDLIFLIRLNDNISIFIRANTYMNATHKLENIIMKEKLDFETRNLSHYLVVYKKWENLEPEIKNAFEAKYRDVDNELIDTNINTDEYVKFMKRPKPASVKITPTEMMMAKPTDGYDRIIDPALEQEKELFLKEMLCNNPLSPSTFFSDGGKTRKLISEHLSSIFNPELSQQIPAYSLEHGLKQSPYPVGYLAKNLSVWGELIYPSNISFDDYVVFKLKINKNLSLFILGRSREDGEKVMNNWLKVQRTLNSDSVPLSYIELGDITGYFNFYKNFCDLELKIKNIFLAEENKEIPKIILFSKNKKKLIRKGIK